MSTQKTDRKQTQKTNVQAFQFLKKLGEGAYSSVYKVRRKEDGQLYALKKVKMKNLSVKQKQNSLNEVRILASIQHQNVVSYKEAFFEAESLYIVMEYADSGDLFNEIVTKKKKQEFYKEQQIWAIFFQICAGLHELHKLKIIHRDLKSANVFINKNRQIKLGDMNVSKIGQLCMTQTGTPYYASPQIWKDMPYDSKSDIWSLGCVLYQMVTFNPPFNGVDMQDLYQNILNGKYEPISNTFSQNLKLMTEGLLEQTPIKRPTTLYILENIEQIVPEMYHSNYLIKSLIKAYSKKNKKQNQKQLYRINELMKTIQFPNKKKNKKMADLEMNSFLPSPSYSKSHRTTKQKSLPKNQIQSMIDKKQFQRIGKQKLKHQSLFIPSINISLDQNNLQKNKKKVNKNNKEKNSNNSKAKYHQKQNKDQNAHYGIRKSSIGNIKQKQPNRLVLPAILNKKIKHRY